MIRQLKLNTRTKSNLERKGLFHLTAHSPPSKKIKALIWSQDLIQKTWSSAAYCLAPCGLQSLHFYITQQLWTTCPRLTPPLSGCAHTYQSSNVEIHS